MDNFRDSIEIKNKLIHFVPIVLFDNKLEIYLPEDFRDMPEELYRIKYPSEKRPQIIKTDAEGVTNFNFNYFNAPIKKGQIEGALKSLINILKKSDPSVEIYEEKTEELGLSLVSYVTFKTKAIDNDIFNIIYITSIENKLLHGMFNCLYADRDEWEPVGKNVIRSIKEMIRKD